MIPRQEYLAKGICPGCKCRNVIPSRTICEVCDNTKNKWMQDNRTKKDSYNRTRYETLKRQGLCIDCKNPTEGNVYCKKCTSIRCARRALRRPLHSRNRWSKR